MPSRPFSEQPNTINSNHQSPPFKDTQYSSGFNSQDKLQSYRPSTAGDQGYNATPRGPPVTSSASHDVAHRPATSAMEPAPDPLTKAFNDAIRPFQLEIEELKSELEYTRDQVQQLHEERDDMHAWIDKRGLRAGMSYPIDSFPIPLILISNRSQTSPPP